VIVRVWIGVFGNPAGNAVAVIDVSVLAPIKIFCPLR